MRPGLVLDLDLNLDSEYNDAEAMLRQNMESLTQISVRPDRCLLCSAMLRMNSSTCSSAVV